MNRLAMFYLSDCRYCSKVFLELDYVKYESSLTTTR